MKRDRTPFAILSLLLLTALLLSGCTGAPESALERGTPAATAAAMTAEEPQEVYIRNDLVLPGEVIATAVWEGEAYLALRRSGRSSVVALSAPETAVYTLPGDAWVEDMTATADGLWLLTGQEVWQIPWQGERAIRSLPAPAGGFYRAVAVDAAGWLYAATESGLVILSETGEERELPLETDSVSGLLRSAQGEILLVRFRLEEGGFFFLLTPVLPETGALDEARERRIDAHYSPVDGSGEREIYLLGPDGLYALEGVGEIVPVILWADNQLPVEELRMLAGLGADAFLGVDAAGPFMLTREREGERPSRSTLILAVFGPTNYAPEIAAFNRESAEYYIETVNYCAGGVGIAEAMARLRAELREGSGPDILCFSANVSPARSAAEGQLRDLYELMEADGSLSREDIVLASLMEQSGRLYALGMDFGIRTWAGQRALLGECSGWTYEEYLDWESSLGDGRYPFAVTPEGSEPLWAAALACSLREYYAGAVDWEGRTCHFDTPAFLRILEITSRAVEKPCPVTDTAGHARQMREGKCLLTELQLTFPTDMQDLEERLGLALCFPGWPTADGRPGGSVHFNESFAISACTDRTDAAWKLIAYLFRNGQEGRHWMPTDRSRLAALMARFSDETGADKYGMARFAALLETVSIRECYEAEIDRLVQEEAAAYFAGDRSAEDTAAAIQARVSAWMAGE